MIFSGALVLGPIVKVVYPAWFMVGHIAVTSAFLGTL